MVNRHDFRHSRMSVVHGRMTMPETVPSQVSKAKQPWDALETWEERLPHLVNALTADVSDETRQKASLKLQEMAELADRYEDLTT